MSEWIKRLIAKKQKEQVENNKNINNSSKKK